MKEEFKLKNFKDPLNTNMKGVGKNIIKGAIALAIVLPLFTGIAKSIGENK